MQVSFKPTIHRHRRHKDNTFSVIIRIGFKLKYVFFETNLSVSKTDLKRNGDIKSANILDRCNELIKKCREIANTIPDIERYDVKYIKRYIEDNIKPEQVLDFLALFSDFIEERKKSPSVQIYKAAYNHLVEFDKYVLVDNV